LQYKATAIGTAGTITVATFASSAAYDASSGRIYEVVTHGSNITWELARCKAKYSNSDVTYSGTSTLNNDRCTSSTALTRRTSSGLKGYLANITSLAEHEFLMTKLNDVGWIGGADTDSEGTFIWMDGPEAGQVFFTPSQSSRRGSYTVSGSVPGFSYGANRFNYFSDGEPNNAGGEHFVEFGYGSEGVGRSWNDCRNGCNRSKYVIEYGGEGGETLQGASGTIAVRTAPTAPTSVSPTAGALQASLTWAAPSSTGGTPVTGYLVEYKASGGSWVTATSNTGSDTRSYTVTGLTGGTTYTFRISAINNAGTSSASTESSGVTISRTNQSITFSSLGTSSKSFPYSQVLSMSTSGSSGTGAITYAIVAGGSATSCALSNSSASATISATSSGTCLVAATIAQDDSYNSATSSNLTFTFSRTTPTFSSWSNVTKTFGDAPYTVTAPTVTGSISGTFTYSSSSTSVISIDGTTFTVAGGGSTTITATFTPTNATDYSSATTTHTVTVSRTSQSITFSSLGTSSKSFPYSQELSMSTSGSSGAGGITYAIVAGGSATSCALTNSSASATISATTFGTCLIAATIAQDANYTSATSSSLTFTFSRATVGATISLAGGSLIFRQANTVSAVSSVAGKVTFKVNGKVLPGCKNKAVTVGNSFTAICSYRPSTRGYVSVTATLDPTEASYIGTTTTTGRYFVGNRTGTRP
jgi:hypothetical protein